MQSFQIEWKKLKAFVYENRWQILLYAALLMLVWGPWMYNSGQRYDTDFWINNPGTTGNWLEIGRQGGILTDYVFGMRWFNLYAGVAFGYVMIGAAGVVFAWLMHRDAGMRAWQSLTLGAVTFCYPIMAEAFFFDMMLFKLAWAYVLTGLAVGFSLHFAFRCKWLSALAGFVCMLWAFGTFQSFVFLHIALTALCFALLFHRKEIVQKRSGTPWLAAVLRIIGLFLAAFIANSVISGFFDSGSNYLQAKIWWGQVGKREILKAVVYSVFGSITGHPLEDVYWEPFYTGFFLLFALTALVIASVQVIRNKTDRKTSWLYPGALVIMDIAPFILNVYFGHMPEVRSQLSYSLVLGGNIVFCLHALFSADFRSARLTCLLRTACCVLAACCLWQAVQTSMRLVYTQNYCEEQEARNMYALVDDIRKASPQDKPVYFVGSTDGHVLNGACLHGESIGDASYLGHDAPYDYIFDRTQLRDLLGLHYIAGADSAEFLQARILSQTMPCWPKTGGVMDAGDYIVVKLGDVPDPRQ